MVLKGLRDKTGTTLTSMLSLSVTRPASPKSGRRRTSEQLFWLVVKTPKESPKLLRVANNEGLKRWLIGQVLANQIPTFFVNYLSFLTAIIKARYFADLTDL